ncbi:unnamed protein product [Spirodela intermedia]|uniref:Uncharacterized protein n=1 Tax=Spirodela intermedia TaxID=51605 RepID=A0A7I8KNL8_SPIIN|nr:unnamed protein product [Spirodela intermedia]
MAESSGLSGRKRFRDAGEIQLGEGSSNDSLTLGDSLTFSDTLMALQMMRAQFPKINKLYSSIKDRTQVDRELESLKKEKVLRIFKLNTGQDDHAVMFMDDYNNQIGVAMKRLGTKNEDLIQVFEWFKTYVTGTKLDVGIDHNELCSLLSFGGKVKEEHVSLLINAGFLTRQLVDPSMYWFSIPNIGLLLKGLSQGRKELVSLLRKRKHREMMLAALEKKRLRLSLLDMRFHLRDLIGSGVLKTVESPTGLIVRLSKD